MNGFSITLGALALVLGALSLMWPLLGVKAHVRVDIFPIILLAVGLYLLIPWPKKEITG